MSDETNLETTEAAEAPKPARAPRRVNRAETERAPEPAPEPSEDGLPEFPGCTIFVSATTRETSEFEVMGVRSFRSITGQLVWPVPDEDAERFERHFFVTSGRIIKK